MADNVRVLICDDHAIVRKGLVALLSTRAGIEVVGEAEDGRQALAHARELGPDVILMDLVMPEVDGIQAITAITSELPGSRILVLTSFAADDKVFPAIKAGALGYLLKDCGPNELVQAIHQVAQGEPSLQPAIARKLLLELHRTAEAPPTVDPLTEREVEVLRLLAQGLSNRQISERLVVTERTVCTHVSNILSKLHLASRTQAALYALKEGLASLGDIPHTD